MNSILNGTAQDLASGRVKNNAGGSAFKISDLDRARRFLILGTTSNMYKPSDVLAMENATEIIKLANDPVKGIKLVDLIVEVSTNGLAAKQDPTLFALAIASASTDDSVRAYALSVLPRVARIGTHLFTYVGYVQQFRGWGSALRKAVASWYLDRNVDALAYQVAKYRQRGGFSHRDLFRLSHPVSSDPAFAGLGEWILRGDPTNAPKLITALEEAKTSQDVVKVVKGGLLSWEMLPTDALTNPGVWTALIDQGSLPVGALVRNLSRLTALGVIGDLGKGKTREVVAILEDPEAIAKSRIHPMQILTALLTYSSTRPVQRVVTALETAYRLSYKNVTPSGARILVGLDVSGSMDVGVATNVSARAATTSMAMVLAATEEWVHTVAFTGGGYYSRSEPLTVIDDKINPNGSILSAIESTNRMPFGSTDCALPIRYAIAQGLDVDAFVIMTDNDANNPDDAYKALEEYRKVSGIDAKLVVVSTLACHYSIANPADPLTLDIAGFSPDVPQVLSSFIKG